MKVLEVLLLLPPLLVTVKGQGTLDQVVFVGGDGFTDVKIFGLLDKQPGGNCSLIPDLHFEPLYSIGLRDHMGRAMVCGGSSKNTSPKACWVLDRASNTWIPGPSMKRGRIGAAAVCDDVAGKCWIFGGRSRSTTEYYDYATNSFVLGPEMHVNSVHGLCAVKGIGTDVIYLAARREPNVLRRFTFDPTTMTFADFDDVDAGMDIRYAACGVGFLNPGSDEFVVVGGGPNVAGGIANGYVNNFALGRATANYPYPMFGAVGIQVEARGTFIVAGGVNPSGVGITDVYAFNAPSLRFELQHGFYIDPPRAHPVAVLVAAEDCPCE